MQKTDFIARVAQQTGVSKKTARQVIETALDTIAQNLADGEKVVLTGFGTFELRQRQARRGVNPQTRQAMTIPASTSPGFSASNSLKELVRQNRSRARGS
ncbi:MAG TPA: HU family DNA-binding protein [Roseiflexaceae bacterium]|nr:HU family DNA-binding protein [Roseiflexaceae bacterium]